ncbi:BBSome-interacting protein 1-like [Dysidea avara]|uniref:BBSome-interacting protein 1-like n=1 Tax=Dysidea avara TaxID=196820 RepID=UPI00332D089D
MPTKEKIPKLREVVPKFGLLYSEHKPQLALCKPKILPLKSVTLEKLEKMQKDAQEMLKMQEALARHQELEERQTRQEI